MWIEKRLCSNTKMIGKIKRGSLNRSPGFSSQGDVNNKIFFFVALHPKSTAMVMAGLSVHLTTLFPGQA